MGKYSIETRMLMLRILDLICEGLGIKHGYFDKELSSTQLLSVNHHIPCPDPSLTLGMPQHSDPNLISMLHECSIPGLQVLWDGQWMNVDPMPNAFLLITGQSNLRCNINFILNQINNLPPPLRPTRILSVLLCY